MSRLKTQAQNKILVKCMDQVWSLSKNQLRKMLVEIIGGKDVDFSNYGTAVGFVAYNITDIDPEIAQNILEDLRG